MNEKLLKWIIYCLGAICLFAFIAVRFQVLFNSVLAEPVVEHYWDKTKYGELYYFSMIRNFREKGLPPAQQKFEYSPKHATINECDILTFGDSFFEFSRHKQFSERLADDFGKKVHYVNTDFPLDYLEKNNYHGKTPKLVIFERVERYIPVTFEKPHTWHPPQIETLSKADQAFTYVRKKIFYEKGEELYDAMLKRSYLTTGIYSVIATIKFNLFGYISKKTPVYKNNGSNSWLFYFDQVNDKKTSFYYKHSQEQIDSIGDNMADLALKLKTQYNMEMVYLPLPAKYTLYHSVINNDPYDDFLPRLFARLDKRGVKYVQVYDDFKKSPDTLYYRTDEHWKQKGIDIAYNKTLDFLKADTTLRGFLNQEPDIDSIRK